MRSNTAIVAPAEMSYKQKLIELSKRLAKRRGDTHEIATLLVSVFHDKSFRDDLGDADDDKLGEALDKYAVEASGLRFHQLRWLLENKPAKADWQAWDGKPLVEMYDEARAEARAKTNGEREQVKVQRVTREQYEALGEEKKHVEAQLKFQKQQTTEALTQTERLEKRVRELEEENARLRGRIEQLEKLTAQQR